MKGTMGVEVLCDLLIKHLASLICSIFWSLTNTEPGDCQLFFFAGESVWCSFLLLMSGISVFWGICLGGGSGVGIGLSCHCAVMLRHCQGVMSAP